VRPVGDGLFRTLLRSRPSSSYFQGKRLLHELWTQQRGTVRTLNPPAVTAVMDSAILIARARRRQNRLLACIAIIAAGLACTVGILVASTVSPLWDLLKKLPLGWDVYVVIVASGAPLMLSILWAIKIQRRAAFEFGMCKDCGYNLHGTSEGICPECGSLIHPGSGPERHMFDSGRFE
jgi:hypothetical protein